MVSQDRMLPAEGLKATPRATEQPQAESLRGMKSEAFGKEGLV